MTKNAVTASRKALSFAEAADVEKLDEAMLHPSKSTWSDVPDVARRREDKEAKDEREDNVETEEIAGTGREDAEDDGDVGESMVSFDLSCLKPVVVVGLDNDDTDKDDALAFSAVAREDDVGFDTEEVDLSTSLLLARWYKS